MIMMHISLDLLLLCSTSICSNFLNAQLIILPEDVVIVFVSFLDYSKAFHKISYWKLLLKLLHDKVDTGVVRLLAYWYSKQLECGPMPNVMAALPNIGGPLCSTPQSLADAHY